jgi:hypothetical protein
MDAMAQVSEPKVEAIPDLDSGASLTVDVTLPAHQPCAVTLRSNTRTLNQILGLRLIGRADWQWSSVV